MFLFVKSRYYSLVCYYCLAINNNLDFNYVSLWIDGYFITGSNSSASNDFNVLISFFIHFDAYTLNISKLSWNCSLFRCSPCNWNAYPFISVESPVKSIFLATVYLSLFLLLYRLVLLPLLLLLVLISVIIVTIVLLFLDDPPVVPDAASCLFFLLRPLLISYHY